ncbi:MAG: hypothetical protein A2142_04910, partial [candidate division Zixibacteria bacterium RBG_16_48_11]
MKKSEIVFLTTALILAAVLGGVVGELIGSFLPVESQVGYLFGQSYDRVGFEAIHLNLYAIDLTLGLRFKFNFVSLLFVILVVVYYRW